MSFKEFRETDSSETNPHNLALFTYGSLALDGIYKQVSYENLTHSCAAIAFGVREGYGDLYPCADITRSISDFTEGELRYFNSENYGEIMRTLDEYEGVADGYYERHVIFSRKTIGGSHMIIPAWIYSRGKKLRT